MSHKFRSVTLGIQKSIFSTFYWIHTLHNFFQIIPQNSVINFLKFHFDEHILFATTSLRIRMLSKIHLPYTNTLYVSETTFPTTFAIRLSRIFAKILYMDPMREICLLYSLISWTLAFFGIRMIKLTFPHYAILPCWWNSSKSLTISAFKVDHISLMKQNVKPSGQAHLLPPQSEIALLSPSSSKGAIRLSISWSSIILNLMILRDGLAQVLLENWLSKWTNIYNFTFGTSPVHRLLINNPSMLLILFCSLINL